MLRPLCKPTIVQLTKIYAGTNYANMDQNTPIILDKKNIPPLAHGNHSHDCIGTSTTNDSALTVATGKDHPGNDEFIV